MDEDESKHKPDETTYPTTYPYNYDDADNDSHTQNKQHSSNPVHLKHCEECREIEIKNLIKNINKKKEELLFEEEATALYQKAIKEHTETTETTEITETTQKVQHTGPDNTVTQKDLDKLFNESKHLAIQKSLIRKKFSDLNALRVLVDQVDQNLSEIQNKIYYRLLRAAEQSNSNTNLLKWYRYLESRLMHASVWNDMFFIRIENDFATINNIKIALDIASGDRNHNATQPNQLVPVDSPINAAFGDCVLLLWFFTRYMEFKYYQPKPFGRRSYFTNHSGHHFTLYMNDEWSWKKKLNDGIKAFMVCLLELEKKMTAKVPGKIDLKKNTVSNYLFLYPNSSKESDIKTFNKAWRYILSNLKVLLATLSKRTK